MNAMMSLQNMCEWP